jgi:hypothetical protein
MDALHGRGAPRTMREKHALDQRLAPKCRTRPGLARILLSREGNWVIRANRRGCQRARSSAEVQVPRATGIIEALSPRIAPRRLPKPFDRDSESPRALRPGSRLRRADRSSPEIDQDRRQGKQERRVERAGKQPRERPKERPREKRTEGKKLRATSPSQTTQHEPERLSVGATHNSQQKDPGCPVASAGTRDFSFRGTRSGSVADTKG